MAFQRKATRSGVKVKGMIDGPSGSGKTFTSLMIATGLVRGDEIIAAIDTQNGQSSRYADTFTFYPEILTQHSPDAYIALIREAEKAKAGCLLIDSATHEWAYILDLVDSINKRSANTGWREATPLHKKFVEAIIQCSVHLLVTCRTKTDWVYQDEYRGNRKIVVPHKVGTKIEQRDQFEYEFDFWLRLDRGNNALVEKSVFDFMPTGTDIGRVTSEIGQKIRAWLDGAACDTVATPQPSRMVAAQNGTVDAPQRPGASRTALKTAETPEEPPDEEDDPDEDEDDPDEDEDDEEGDAEGEPIVLDTAGRARMESRYRTLAAVAVVSGHVDRYKLAGIRLEALDDEDLYNRVQILEETYENIPESGAYQCGVCGTKIYPHVFEESAGVTFPGLQLIALGVRDFKKPLCAAHLAAERKKRSRRAP